MISEHDKTRQDEGTSQFEPSAFHFEFYQDLGRQQKTQDKFGAISPGGRENRLASLSVDTSRPEGVHPEATTVTCYSPTTSGSNTYPQNYLWICDDPQHKVTQGDVNAVRGALGHLGGVQVGANSDAKQQMANNKHYIYVFPNDDDYNGANAYCTGTGDGNNTANSPAPGCHALNSSQVALTTLDGQTGIDQSVVIESRVNDPSTKNTSIANTTAHEAGHQLDDIYGRAIYSGGLASAPSHEFGFKLTGETVTLSGGPITAGDVLNLKFQGTRLSSPVTISHTVESNDTLPMIANKFANAINGNNTLAGLKVHATTNSDRDLLVMSSAILTYSESSTGVNGHNATEVMTLSNYDWPAFDAAIACKEGSGVFQIHKDVNGAYICSSLAQGTVGGTVQARDIVSVTVTDQHLSKNPESAGYEVQPGDNLTNIAAGIATAINNDQVLKAGGVTATSSGSMFNISSGTNNSTYAPGLSIGATETLTGLSTVTAGDGDTLSNAYSVKKTNDAVLQPAWPHYFTDMDAPYWSELFAEETAVVAGQVAPLGQTQDDYLGSGNFICSKNFVNAIENSGKVPDPNNFPYSSGCK